MGFFVLDNNKFWNLRRRTRGYLGLAVVASIVAAVWTCSLVWQVRLAAKLERSINTRILTLFLAFVHTSNLNRRKPYQFSRSTIQNKGRYIFFLSVLHLPRCALMNCPSNLLLLLDYIGDSCYQALAYWIM